MKKLQTFMLVFLVFLMLPAGQAWAIKVVVDAGHGGSDPGARGVNGLYEKDVNLDLAYKLQQELTRRGYEAVMSRTDDRYISLQERVDFTNAQHADLFVSVHANDYANPATRGSMVLYYDSRYPQEKYPASEAMTRLSPSSRKLAQSVLDALVAEAGTENRGLLPSAAYVIRMGQVPSILVETAFLSNPEDAAMLADDAVRRKMAIGIAKGIEAYLPAQTVPPAPEAKLFPDTLGHWAREAILRLQDKGIIEGIDNRFEPDRAMTRAEYLTILNRMFPFPEVGSERAAQSDASGGQAAAANGDGQRKPAHEPADLPKEHWAYDTFKRALALGYIDGYPDGTVRPDRPITRGEVAVLFDRVLVPNSAQMKTFDAVFKDVPAQLWSAKAIYYLRERGLIDGMTADTFMPDRYMTRAEMAALADRYITLQAGSK